MRIATFLVTIIIASYTIFCFEFGEVKISEARNHDFTKLVINDGKSDVSIPLLISKKEFENIIDKSNFEIDTNFSYLASNYLSKANNACGNLRINGEFGNWWHGFDLHDLPEDSCNLFWVFCDTNNYFGVNCENIFTFPKVYKDINLYYCIIPIFYNDNLVSINFVLVYDNLRVNHSIKNTIKNKITKSKEILELTYKYESGNPDDNKYKKYSSNSFNKAVVPMNELKLVEFSTNLLTCFIYELNYVPKLKTGKEANKK